MNSVNIKRLDSEFKIMLERIALTIRVLSIDSVQKADSGHPGLPMGCAEIGAYLFSSVLKYNPKNPNWFNRDRFILSAGHGSMLLYSVLHLSGYDLSLEDLKNFRQLHSKTPGHPESLDTPGIETTTGPLGQGFANAVGQALGMKLLQARFNTKKHKIIDNKIFVLMGDGCVMEGVTSETSSLAGHLKLDNLIAIYDSNSVTLDGSLDQSCSEDTKMRYESYGWEVLEVEGNDLEDLNTVMSKALINQTRPRLIIAKTIIGKGSPNKAGTFKVHGSPLGEAEVKETKIALGASLVPFYVDPSIYEFFKKKAVVDAAQELSWKETFNDWAKDNPEKLAEFEAMSHHRLPKDLEDKLQNLNLTSPIAGRKASQDTLNFLVELLPQLYGGSADLSCSDLTMLNKFPIVTPTNFSGRNIKFGVREFGMAAMATGLAETGLITPFIGTFLTFSDYMRNAIRLAALMKTHVIYQFTHDSIFLGEDGPTHQPIEQIASLRAIPNLYLFRPCDANEVKMSWIGALSYQGPVALILSRQNLKELKETKISYSEGVGRGAYIIKKEMKKPDYTIVATGSEVHLALDVSIELEKMGKNVRVISMPCSEIFELQSQEYRESLFGGDIGKRVSIEAGVEMGWHKYIGLSGVAISMKGFGASAKASDLAKEFGFTVDAILERIL